MLGNLFLEHLIYFLKKAIEVELPLSLYYYFFLLVLYFMFFNCIVYLICFIFTYFVFFKNVIPSRVWTLCFIDLLQLFLLLGTENLSIVVIVHFSLICFLSSVLSFFLQLMLYTSRFVSFALLVLLRFINAILGCCLKEYLS